VAPLPNREGRLQRIPIITVDFLGILRWDGRRPLRPDAPPNAFGAACVRHPSCELGITVSSANRPGEDLDERTNPAGRFGAGCAASRMWAAGPGPGSDAGCGRPPGPDHARSCLVSRAGRRRSDPDHDRGVGGGPERSRRVDAAAWRWPSMVVCPPAAARAGGGGLVDGGDHGRRRGGGWAGRRGARRAAACAAPPSGRPGGGGRVYRAATGGVHGHAQLCDRRQNRHGRSQPLRDDPGAAAPYRRSGRQARTAYLGKRLVDIRSSGNGGRVGRRGTGRDVNSADHLLAEAMECACLRRRGAGH